MATAVQNSDLIARVLRARNQRPIIWVTAGNSRCNAYGGRQCGIQVELYRRFGNHRGQLACPGASTSTNIATAYPNAYVLVTSGAPSSPALSLTSPITQQAGWGWMSSLFTSTNWAAWYLASGQTANPNTPFTAGVGTTINRQAMEISVFHRPFTTGTGSFYIEHNAADSPYRPLYKSGQFSTLNADSTQQTVNQKVTFTSTPFPSNNSTVRLGGGSPQVVGPAFITGVGVRDTWMPGGMYFATYFSWGGHHERQIADDLRVMVDPTTRRNWWSMLKSACGGDPIVIMCVEMGYNVDAASPAYDSYREEVGNFVGGNSVYFNYATTDLTGWKVVVYDNLNATVELPTFTITAFNTSTKLATLSGSLPAGMSTGSKMCRMSNNDPLTNASFGAAYQSIIDLCRGDIAAAGMEVIFSVSAGTAQNAGTTEDGMEARREQLFTQFAGVDDVCVWNDGPSLITQAEILARITQPGSDLVHPDFGAFAEVYKRLFDQILDSSPKRLTNTLDQLREREQVYSTYDASKNAASQTSVNTLQTAVGNLPTTAPDNASIAAIKAKTDLLGTNAADSPNVIAMQTAVGNLPTTVGAQVERTGGLLDTVSKFAAAIKTAIQSR